MNVAREPQLLTIEDFDQLPHDDKLNDELLDGILYMSPRPNVSHARCHFNLIRDLGRALQGHSRCQGYNELELQIGDDTILVPDIMVICDTSKLTRQRYLGIPLLVVEILSEATLRRDLIYKLNKYESIGIAEYWIVDPKTKSVTVHDFANGSATLYDHEETITSQAVPEIVIDLSQIFE